MASLRRWLARLGDRRREQRPVKQDRRAPSVREAKDRLSQAHAQLDEFLKKHRGESKSIASNDRQQVVIFSTWRDICASKGPDIGGLRLCRHKDHPDAANSELAICEECKCPTLSLAMLKGAA